MIADTDLHLLKLQPFRGDWVLGHMATTPTTGVTLAASGMLYNNPEYAYQLFYHKKSDAYVLFIGGYYHRLLIQTSILK